ncbi:MAG TPA: biotin transporter BioY [Ruminococcus sp.]|nr:biotin transporter BioY [Ruminococcus sp.]
MSQATAAPARSKFTTKEIVLTALMAVIMAVCSWISIPTEVPFTLQTFAVFCALLLLGGRNGFFSVLVYILLGAVGIPVFAGFSGGMGVILGTTGGYIVGFLLLALTYWLAEKIPVKGTAPRIAVAVIAMIIGTALCYAFGTFWFMHVYAKKVEAISLETALKWCVIPFIPVDLIKLAVAVPLCESIKKYAKL